MRKDEPTNKNWSNTRINVHHEIFSIYTFIPILLLYSKSTQLIILFAININFLLNKKQIHVYNNYNILIKSKSMLLVNSERFVCSVKIYLHLKCSSRLRICDQARVECWGNSFAIVKLDLEINEQYNLILTKDEIFCVFCPHFFPILSIT